MLRRLVLVLSLAVLSVPGARAANVRDWRRAIRWQREQFHLANQHRLLQFYQGTLPSALPTTGSGGRVSHRRRHGAVYFSQEPPAGPGPAPAAEAPLVEMPETTVQDIAARDFASVWEVVRRAR